MPEPTYANIAHGLYFISVLACFVAAATIAVRRHRYARTVLGYGLLWATPIFVAEALFLAFCWMMWEDAGLTSLEDAIVRDDLVLDSIITTLSRFIGAVLFVVSGMYLAVRSGRSSLPLTRGFERYWKTPGGVSITTPMLRTCLEAALVAAFSLSFTVFVFSIAQPKETEATKNMMRAIGEGAAANLLLLKGLVSAPLFEEIAFRQFMQRAFGRLLGGQVRGRAIAIGLASLFWAFAHAGVMDPEWAKFAQTFGIGLALGWLYDRRGLEASVLAHFLFNAVTATLVTLFQ